MRHSLHYGGGDNIVIRSRQAAATLSSSGSYPITRGVRTSAGVGRAISYVFRTGVVLSKLFSSGVARVIAVFHCKRCSFEVHQIQFRLALLPRPRGRVQRSLRLSNFDKESRRRETSILLGGKC